MKRARLAALAFGVVAPAWAQLDDEDPELDAPECLVPALEFALPIAQGIIQDFDPRIFCGSPSGAFVE